MALVEQRYLWPNPKTGPYRLQVYLAEVNGRLAPVKWTISGEPLDGHPDGLPTVALGAATARRVPWVRICGALADEMKTRWEPLVAPVSPETANKLALPGSRQGRPTLYDEAHWGDVAAVYRAATETPVRAVAEHFTVSRSLARKWVERCRQKGLLG